MYGRQIRPDHDFVRFEREEIERSIPVRFEKQAANYGDRIAVKCEGREITYHELNKRANRIARAILEQRGEGQEPIALLLQPGVSMISGILGVSKSGKIYMPMATWLPHARIDYMLQDSQTSLILTDSKNLHLARSFALRDVQLLNIDEVDPEPSADNLNLTIKPDDPAWIHYTSGSTGQPKGVLGTHRHSLHNNMQAINDMRISMNDRVASLGLPGTDFRNAILSGATFHRLDIRSEGVAGLADWLIREKITICTFVVTTFRHFVDTLTGEKFPHLRLICLASEPVYRRDVEAYRRHFSPDCVLLNQMGITEVGTVCRYFIDRETQIDSDYVPVGYPISDKEVLLLDEDGKAVKANQTGEIAVRSRYLCKGYWRKPELTQAKFLPDPEGGDKRIYLTGDLGRMLPDGKLVHLGRKDFQMKIRGYRVEVSEIETALLNLDAIKEAAIVARADSHGDQRLVAYLVPVDSSRFTVSMLRRALGEALPDYMLPSALVMMDVLPLTPSGKIDRLALPDPGTARPELDTAFAAPRTPVEKTLVEIWSDALGLDEIGIHDDFFDLGGNSLLATQIISRVINTFQVRMPLRSLFQSPTVADMAVAIVQNMAEKVESKDIEQMLAELAKLPEDEAGMEIYRQKRRR